MAKKQNHETPTGNAAFCAAIKALKSGAKERQIYFKYPLRDGYSKIFFLTEGESFPIEYQQSLQRDEWSPIEPLNEHQKKLVMFFTDGFPNVDKLYAFLQIECKISQLKLTWQKIIWILIQLAKKHNIEPETIEQYPTMTYAKCAIEKLKNIAIDDKTTNIAQQTKLQKKVKPPSKESIQAYKFYYGTGKTQKAVAKTMTNRLKKPVNQGQVSRWVNQYKKWRDAEGIPVDDTRPNIIVNSNILDVGARTDGRLTGDPRHKKNTDYKH